MTLTYLQAWLVEWAEIWSVPELPDRATVRPSRRIRRSLGRCHPRTGKIQLHPSLLDGPGELLREVVCHEAAHLAVYLIHGHGPRPHGPEWAALVRAAGYEPTTRMPSQRLPQTLRETIEPRILYRHTCSVCGASRTARRSVRAWRCRRCHDVGLGGRLEICSIPAEVPRP